MVFFYVVLEYAYYVNLLIVFQDKPCIFPYFLFYILLSILVHKYYIL